MKLKGLMTLLLMASMVPASATIARLNALGMNETDNEGSYFIDDDRNIFLNVANVNAYSDSVILEWGDAGNILGANTQTRTDANHQPKAKGGFLKKSGNLTYGLYMGNESNTSSLLRVVGSSTNAVPTAATAGALDGADNQIDAFIGGKAGFGDWGAALVYTSDKFNNGTTRGKDMAHAVKVGVKNDQWQAFLNLSTGTQVERVSSTVADEFDGKFGFHAGGSYNINNMGTVYGFMKKFDWDQKDRGTSIEGGFMTYALGYGGEYQNGKNTFFTSVEYRHKEIEVKYAAKAEAKNVQVPLMVGYEYQATSWLTLRGSVTQRVVSYRENNNYSSLNPLAKLLADAEFGLDTSGKKVTDDTTTDVRAGASLNLGRVRIDGLLGLGRNDGTINASSTERGALDLDRLMARVGMVYNF